MYIIRKAPNSTCAFFGDSLYSYGHISVAEICWSVYEDFQFVEHDVAYSSLVRMSSISCSYVTRFVWTTEERNKQFILHLNNSLLEIVVANGHGLSVAFKRIRIFLQLMSCRIIDIKINLLSCYSQESPVTLS